MYQQVLLPVDLNDESSWRKALPTALGCCEAFGAKLHVVTVVPDLKLPLVASYFPADFEAKARAEIERQLQRFVDAHVPKALGATHAVLSGGTVYEQILAAAHAQAADLIVIGAHRPELKDYLLGPNAARVVRHASQSVWVVRE